MKVDLDEIRRTSSRLVGNVPGVYFLFDGEELVYIGKGWNCLLRVAEHTRKESEKQFTSWGFVQIDDPEEYSRLERELIAAHAPKYNKTYVAT